MKLSIRRKTNSVLRNYPLPYFYITFLLFWISLPESERQCDLQKKRYSEKQRWIKAFIQLNPVGFVANRAIWLVCICICQDLTYLIDSLTLEYSLERPKPLCLTQDRWKLLEFGWAIKHTPSPWLTWICFTRISLTCIFKKFPFLT